MSKEKAVTEAQDNALMNRNLEKLRQVGVANRLSIDDDNPPPSEPYFGEVRITDPTTGGEKGKKQARFSLIPGIFLWELAEHYGKGAVKYSDDNWKKGYQWSLSYDALQRHIHQWKGGERFDIETGTHHLVAAAWHCICLWFFDKYAKGTNDLDMIPPPEQEDLL